MRHYILPKDIIEQEIVEHLPKNKRGFSTCVPLEELFNAVLYKLSSGVQWRNLPVEVLFTEESIGWNAVYYHFRKWAKGNLVEGLWLALLEKHRDKLDLSLCNLDGSQTRAVKGGKTVAYQGRKKAKTTNALFISDRQGVPLVMSEPSPGNRNDLYKIKQKLKDMVNKAEGSKVSFDGVFMNADAGFHSAVFAKVTAMQGIVSNVKINPRNNKQFDIEETYVFDNEAYKNRFVVERSFGWLDKFRSVLTRFDHTTSSWKAMNYLGILVIGLEKFLDLKV